MKLKIVSSSIAILATALMLSACVPEVPTVSTVPTTTLPPLTNASYSQVKCGTSDGLGKPTGYAETFFTVTESLTEMEITFNIKPTKIEQTPGSTYNASYENVLAPLREARAGSTFRLKNVEFKLSTDTYNVNEFTEARFTFPSKYGSDNVAIFDIHGTYVSRIPTEKNVISGDLYAMVTMAGLFDWSPGGIISAELPNSRLSAWDLSAADKNWTDSKFFTASEGELQLINQPLFNNPDYSQTSLPNDFLGTVGQVSQSHYLKNATRKIALIAPDKSACSAVLKNVG